MQNDTTPKEGNWATSNKVITTFTFDKKSGSQEFIPKIYQQQPE